MSIVFFENLLIRIYNGLYLIVHSVQANVIVSSQCRAAATLMLSVRSHFRHPGIV